MQQTQPSGIYARDIVMHEEPKPARVARMVKALKTGRKLPPISICRHPDQHWIQGPKGGMIPGRFGHGLLNGHHRLAGYLAVYGPDYEFDRSEIVFKL